MMLALGWLVTATMFQLTVSIRVIFNLITQQKALKLKNIVYIYAAIMSSAQIFWVISIPYIYHKNFDRRSKAVSYAFIIDYLILTISYCGIIIYLCKTLQRMSNFGDFSEQHRDILIQFLVFLMAFISKLILQALFLIGAHFDWDSYTYYMMQIVSFIFVDIMPVTYMLYSHHKTYKISPEESMSGLQS